MAELAAECAAKELLTTTVRPTEAEAEAEAGVKRADGDRFAAIAAAQAEAEKVRCATCPTPFARRLSPSARSTT